MKKIIMVSVIAILVINSAFADNKEYTIKSESGVIKKAKAVSIKKNLPSESGCLFPEIITKKQEGKFILTLDENDQKSCTVVIENEAGQKAQLTCDQDECKVFQSKSKTRPMIKLEDNKDGSYTIK